MKNAQILVLISLILFACNSKNGQKEEQFILPEGAIPIVYSRHLYIQGKADSVHGNFVFDTGADNLYYDSVFYADNHFVYKSFAHAKLPGAGTRPQDVIVILDTVDFSFGKHNYQTSLVPVLKLKQILGDFSDGIIGVNCFSSGVLEISYTNEYFILHESINSIDVADYRKIPLKMIDNRYYLPLKIQVNDTLAIEGIFGLDFGSAGSISITSSAAREFHLDEAITKKVFYHTKYGGVGGESSRYSFRADKLQISDIVFRDVTMDYSIDKSGAMASDKHFGLLGNKILERFDILIDFKEKNLYLRPNKTITEPFLLSRLGFSYVDRNQTLGVWKVTGIYENSSAEKNGLKIDDEIISVNNIPISQIQYEAQNDFFEELSKAELAVKRGDKQLIIKVDFQSLLK